MITLLAKLSLECWPVTEISCFEPLNTIFKRSWWRKGYRRTFFIQEPSIRKYCRVHKNFEKTLIYFTQHLTQMRTVKLITAAPLPDPCEKHFRKLYILLLPSLFNIQMFFINLILNVKSNLEVLCYQTKKFLFYSAILCFTMVLLYCGILFTELAFLERLPITGILDL